MGLDMLLTLLQPVKIAELWKEYGHLADSKTLVRLRGEDDGLEWRQMANNRMTWNCWTWATAMISTVHNFVYLAWG